MAKFVFTTNFDWTSPAPECSKSNPPCPYMPMRRFFKKGDTIEGNVVPNTLTSEPPNFLESGAMRIGFGGRDSQIIMPVATTGTAIPIGKDNRGNTQKSSSSFVWTPMKKVVAVALAIAAVLGILKLAKVI